MRTFLFRFLFALMMAGSLFGCGTPVVNGCEIPEQYDVVKSGPVDLTDAELKAHLEQEAAQRHEHKKTADDYNGFHDFVRDHCNK